VLVSSLQHKVRTESETSADHTEMPTHERSLQDFGEQVGLMDSLQRQLSSAQVCQHSF